MQKIVSSINEETRRETVAMVTPGLPYMSAVIHMDDYPDRGSQWHWHNEVEFFYVRKGAVEYRVSGGVHVFREGEAGFVNANVLHRTCGSAEEPTDQEIHIFLPVFISGHATGDIEKRYIQPVLREGDLDIVRFQDAGNVISRMRSACEAYSSGEEGFELQVRALISEVWMQLFRETRNLCSKGDAHDEDDGRIKAMLAFIASHYGERIDVEDIAGAGCVSKRECFRIFKRVLLTTPVDYLIGHRIASAAEMLRNTEMPVQEVAQMTGFLNSSYFGKVFRERMGLTPREYRMAK